MSHYPQCGRAFKSRSFLSINHLDISKLHLTSSVFAQTKIAAAQCTVAKNFLKACMY